MRKIQRAEFRSAEKSVERTALRTRTGAKPMGSDHRPALEIIVLLLVMETVNLVYIFFVE